MKRCIICGNVDDDSSTVCSTCGNPYVDMGEQASDVEEERAEQAGEAGEQDAASEEIEGEAEESAAGQDGQAEAQEPEAEQNQPEEFGQTAAQQAEPEESEQTVARQAEPEEPQQAGQAEAPQQGQPTQRDRQSAEIPRQASGGRPPRRTRSGPQIYGQAEGMDGNPGMYANQGAIRRNVPPRSTGTGRPMGQMPEGAGRPMGQMSGRTGRPMSQMPGGAGRPTGQDFRAKRVMEIARRAMRSPLFFLIALLNTVGVAASIAAIFLKELNYSQLVRLLNDASLPQQMSGYVSSATKLLQNLDSGMIPANLALHIPSILFCLGLWLIFFTALAAKERMSGVGFGFAKAAIIIRMIVACIVMLGVLIVTVTVVVAAWVSKQTPVIVMAVIMLVITIIIVMMVIMYYFAYLGTLKACRVNGDTGESYGKPSGYLAVMLIILALPGIVGVLSGIVNMEISNIIGSVAEMGWMLLLAVWIFIYRGKMSELEE